MKRGHCAVLRALAAGALAIGSTSAQACEPAKFDLNHIELRDVARAVSDLTGQAIALDQSVHGVRLDFVVDTGSCDEILARFEQLAVERGWLVGVSSHHLHVMGVPSGPRHALRRMYRVPDASALQWAQRARTLLSPDANVQAPDARRLLIVASEADHTRLQELLAEEALEGATVAPDY